jgi:hypothetical protein
LACTKAPPADFPDHMTAGLGSCLAPRNHDGPCQYPAADGGRAMLFQGGRDPVTMVAEIERLYYRTRRAYVVSLVATSLSVFSAVFLVLRAFGQAWP